jgi:hypothetical protein
MIHIFKRYFYCPIIVYDHTLFVVIVAVLGFELRAYTLKHSTIPFCDEIFSRQGLVNFLPRLALNCDPPDLYLWSS